MSRRVLSPASRTRANLGVLGGSYIVKFNVFFSARRADLSRAHLFITLQGLTDFGGSRYGMNDAQRRFVLNVGISPPSGDQLLRVLALSWHILGIALCSSMIKTAFTLTEVSLLHWLLFSHLVHPPRIHRTAGVLVMN